MATCQRCKLPIIWVPKPSGEGYFRPLETVKIEDAARLFVVENRTTLLDITDAIVQFHECSEDKAPRPRVVTDDDEEAAGGGWVGPERPLSEAEELEIRRREAAEADDARWRVACERTDPYFQVECSRCGAPAREPCHSLAPHLAKTGRKVATVQAHHERQALYWGQAGFGPDNMEDPNPRRYWPQQKSGVARVLYPWHTIQDEKRMRDWLNDHVGLLIDLGGLSAQPADS